MIEWKVGDEVAIVSLYSGPRIQRITRVMKQYVETSDGRKWSLDGTQRPKPRWRERLSIEPVTDAHREQIERSRLVRRVHESTHRADMLSRLSTATLRCIAAALDADEAMREAAHG